jgi:hypothetical protein
MVRRRQRGGREPRLVWRDALVVGLPAIALLSAALWFALHHAHPAPPRRLSFAAGAAGGAYDRFARRYRDILARDGVTLEIVTTQGSVDNAERLADPSARLHAGFVQGGAGRPADAPELVSLGTVALEPLWVFCKGPSVDRLPALRGRSIAVGAPGSGTRRLVYDLLATNELTDGDVQLVDSGGLEAAAALTGGKVDCAFLVSAPEADAVRTLLRAPGVSLMDFTRAEAYTRRLRFLERVTLPEGSVDLARNIPPRDVDMVATGTEILVQRELHPAIQMLLLQAAREVHGEGGMFNRPGEFPRPQAAAFPLSDDALRYYRSGRPFLQRYLPFWVANLIDRFLVLGLPVLAVAFPLFRIVPPLYRWRVRRRIYRWYGELMFIENEARSTLTAGERRDYVERLAAIEHTVDELAPPLAYADQLYALRQHIDYVREKLTRAVGGEGGERRG